MISELSGEREADIAKAAYAEGFRINRGQPSALHRRGLIPRPLTRSLGRGRGTESVYPSGTATQVVAYLKLKKKYGADYERIGWELYILGFPVADRYWRKPLRRASHTFAHTAQFATDREDIREKPILSEKCIEAIEKVTASRSNSRALGEMRRKLRGRLTTLLRMILEVAFGIFEIQPGHDSGEHKYDISVLRRILGTEAASKKRKPCMSPSSLTISVDEFFSMLEKLARSFAKHPAKKSAKSTSVSEVTEAKYELTMLLGFFLSIGNVERQAYGRSSPALHLLALIVWDMNVERHALLLLFWVRARRIPNIAREAKLLVAEINRPPCCTA